MKVLIHHSGHVLGAAAIVLCAALAAADDATLVDAVRQQDKVAVQAAIKRGEVNRPAGDGSTALQWAVHLQDAATVELLLTAGANVNAADDLGTTALALAALNRDDRLVTRLLAKGANPNLVSLNGTSPLMIAARTGAAGAVRALLIKGADINATERTRKQTALMWAAAEAHPETVKVLLEAGADFRARTLSYPQPVSFGPERPTKDPAAFGIIQKGGSTALLFAARSGDVESSRLLIVAGASLNETLPDGQSALILAARSGHEKLAVFLVEQGSDPNIMTTGYAPLHIAVLHDQTALVRALLAHGANPNIQITNGTPIRRNSGDLELAVGNGVSVPTNLLGATPFLLASKYADAELMRMLIDAKADPRPATIGGITPLMAAAGLGWGERQTRRGIDYSPSVLASDGMKSGIVKVREEKETLEAVTLITQGAFEIDAVDGDGSTALFGAVTQGFPSVVKLLIEKGAHPNWKNKKGQTPLSLTQNKDPKAKAPVDMAETAQILRALGATE